jgi:uncharacterized protein YaiE (UPF0345 family)
MSSNAPAGLSTLSFTLIGLRAAALALSLSGNTKAASAVYALADAAEAGRAVDEHMKAVAEKLKSRSAGTDDWSEVAAALEADTERLGHAPTG